MKYVIMGLSLAVVASCNGGHSDADTAAAAESQMVRKSVIQDRFPVTESQYDFSGTMAALFEALDRRDLTVFAVIDHQAGAQSVDMELGANSLVIFGNPALGTPLLQSEPLVGAELPLKALVYEHNGKVNLALSGAPFLQRAYLLGEDEAIIKQIDETMRSIASEATGDQ
ncbi:DUF302 domain-containing protein [Parvularcula bermudensis]|nr:DUF302 domain-containing protein [Parvularcula bermudensis]